MKEQWQKWFISKLFPLTGIANSTDRKYSFKNIPIEVVPFHSELKDYIFSLSNITKNTEYNVYHLHKWDVGCFFNEHADTNLGRKWAYVKELQSSDCSTSLIVNKLPSNEAIFTSDVLHKVPKILEGTRISLTVFGKPLKTAI